MDLMPHIKALLDDLINITEKITVKRSDIAERNDTNTKTLALYQQYLKVLNGDTTFYSYYTYPKEVIRKYTKWIEQETPDRSSLGALVPLLDSKDVTKQINNNSLTFSYREPEFDINNLGKDGDVWVKYNNQSSSFYKINDYKVTRKDFMYKIYGVNSNGKINPNDEIVTIKFKGNNLEGIKNRSLFVYDQTYEKYVPVEISFKYEYKEYDRNTYSENDGWITYEETPGVENNLFIINDFYDNSMISYDEIIYHKLKDPKLYYLRYKLYVRYTDPFYYDDVKYKLVGEEIPESYTLHTKVPFYFNDDLYQPLYEQSGIGDYYYNKDTESFELIYSEIETEEEFQEKLNSNIDIFYKNNNNEFYLYDGELNGPFYYIKDEINELPHYMKMSNSNSIFYCYIDEDGDKILNVDDRYLVTDDDTIKLFYSFGDEEKAECKPALRCDSEEISWSTFNYPETVDGKQTINEYTINDTSYNRYYFYPTDISSDKVYKRITDENDNILYYTKDVSAGSYKITTKKSDMHDTAYYFYHDDIKIYSCNRIFDEKLTNRFNKDRNEIPEVFREDFKTLMEKYISDKYCPTRDNKDYSVPLYYGETNNYYRELNGIPPLRNDVGLPKINRLSINPYYIGDKSYCHIFELSDSEIMIIEQNGMLDTLKAQYPNAGYLNYLGENRIDVVEAREAGSYDILKIGEADFSLSKSMFIENYRIAKNYILNRQFHPELFGEHPYYFSYIGFTICVMTMILCMSKSGDILIQNKFMDAKTVDNIFRSFGFNGTFDSIPFIYRRNIARKLYSLIRNKGIDAIYEKVINIFNIDADVYKYYFNKKIKRNKDGSLKGEYKETYLQPIIFTHTDDANVLKEAFNLDDLTKNKLFIYDIDNSEYRLLNSEEVNLLNNDISSILDLLFIANKNTLIDRSIDSNSLYVKCEEVPEEIDASVICTLNNEYFRKLSKDEMKLIKNVNFTYEYSVNSNEYLTIYSKLYKVIIDHDIDISIAQSSIDSENIIKDINNPSNELSYKDITDSDIYWGVYQSKDSIEEEIKNIRFNYMDSKYVTLNNRFSLTELNFNSSYLLNYFLESTKFNNNSSIYASVEDIEEPQLLQNLIVTLFAIQAIKFGFDGNIPNDIISAAAIYKFNLDQEILDESSGKIKKIIDYYIDYMSQSAVISLQDIQDKISDIVNTNSLSIKSPIYNDKSDKTITDIVKTYMKNISKDNKLTNVDENSLYNKLVDLRENAKTITDFRCFNDLLSCISICKETNKAYKLDNPVWEPMYHMDYKKINSTYSPLNDSETIHYIDIRKSWDILSYNDKRSLLDNLNKTKYYRLTEYNRELGSDYVSIDEYDENIHTRIDDKEYYQHFLNLPDNMAVSTIIPGLNDYNNKTYVICIHDLTRNELLSSSIDDVINKIDIYKQTNILENLNYEIYINTLLGNDIYNTNIIKQISSIPIGFNNRAYIGNIQLTSFVNEGYNLNGPIIYVEVIKDNTALDDIYSLTIYRKCESALSYDMYLREKAPALYKYISKIDNESNDSYIERINKFSSTIIATIEDSIESDTIKDNLNLSYVDFSNVSKYIKLIINVFKSYTIDLSSMDTIYTIDDKLNNRIKMIENYNTNEKYGIKSNLHVNDNLASREKYYQKDFMKIKDEIYIEYYSRQFYDIDHDSVDDYYRINNSLFSDEDFRISAYWYKEFLKQKFCLNRDIEKVIGKEFE